MIHLGLGARRGRHLIEHDRCMSAEGADGDFSARVKDDVAEPLRQHGDTAPPSGVGKIRVFGEER